MSICVIIKVGEGLVLATDSAASVMGTPMTAEGKPGPQGVMKVFYTGSKLFQIGELPIGVFSWGAGSFRERTIASLVEEFENQKEISELKPKEFDIENVSNLMWKFMKKKSDEFFKDIPIKARPKTGLIVCGYSKENFFPEEYKMVVPIEEPSEIKPNINGNPNFGANWYGMTDAIIRFHHGRDNKIFDILKKKLKIEDETIAKLQEDFAKELQYVVLFHAMPLGDAVMYAKFLIELTIARFRFVVGAELCGGPIEIAAITRKEGFKRLSEKTYNI